jgi:glycosyltransferase involved in cell wall biosynthesis
MSVYNGLPHLDRAIESIVEQTYSNFEFLIIDDASTDGSREVLKKWAQRDDRIRLVVHEENKGLGAALAEGVEKARTPWIARMDDDDISMPDRLERQMGYVSDAPEVDILGGWALECDQEGNVRRTRKFPTDHEDIVRLIWTCPIQHTTVLFRREAIRQAGSYDSGLRRRQDYDLWFRCVDEGFQFHNLPTPLIYYRVTDAYYENNDISVALDQVAIGWRGCKRVGAPVRAYLGVLAPLIRALLPTSVAKQMQKLIQELNPRSQ